VAYTPALKPYAHQEAALARCEGREVFAWLMAMRTGKTKVAIDDWGRLLAAGEVSDLMVVAPGGVYRTWEDELRKHLDPGFLPHVKVAPWVSSNREAEFAVTQMIRSPSSKWTPRVLLMNVEALSSSPISRIAASEFITSSACGVMMAVDESTTVKNEKAERTQMVWQLGKRCHYRRILSGLPTPRNPLDLWGQMGFLDPRILGMVSLRAFEDRYADIQTMKVGAGHRLRVPRRFKNLEELRAKLEPHSFRVRLQDCADIPPKMYLFRDVELTPEQERIYADLETTMESQLSSGDYVNTTQRITQILRMHQVCCGHVVDEQGKHHEIPSNRIRDLVAMLADYDGKAVIWASYGWDTLAIHRAIGKAFGGDSVALFWGGNRNEREDESLRFTGRDKCRFMVATPGSGGRGRTWDCANMMVFYSNTDNLEHRDQAEERATAVTKEERVTIVDMRARGTIEDKIILALRKKIDLASIITGDKWREWVV
jgi:SNF2-related domain